MDLGKQKEAATTSLPAPDKLNPVVLASLILGDFEFEMMGRLPGVKPIRGKRSFPLKHTKTLTTMFLKVGAEAYRDG
jgi:hypothetical protein